MGGNRSVVGWLHLVSTSLLAGGLLILGVLLATRTIEIRAVPQVRADNQPKEVTPPALPVGPRIELVAGASEYFAMFGDEAYVFKFHGARIDFWIEVEIDGKRIPVEGMEDLDLRSRKHAATVLADCKVADSDVSGHLVWVRRKRDGKEVWDLGITFAHENGTCKVGARQLGIVPPRPAGFEGLRVGGYRPPQGGSLSDGQEVTLVDFNITGDGAKMKRTMLKCKAAK